jgi:hypothetical protein
MRSPKVSDLEGLLFGLRFPRAKAAGMISRRQRTSGFTGALLDYS